MKATMSQAIQPSNMLKYKDLVNAVMDNLETDMNIDDILPYVPYTLDLDFDNVRTEQLPGESELCNKVWVYIHDKADTATLVEDLTNMLETAEVASTEEEGEATNTVENE